MKELDAKEILRLLPHRYPFILVDRVLEVNPERGYIKAVKNVTVNEPFFQGHFPENPIMPGVLIVEAMAQVGGLYIKICMEDCKDKGFVLAGLDKVRFRQPVTPGDTLVLVAEGFKRKGRVIKSVVKAMVNEKLVAEAEITAAIVEEAKDS